MTSSQPILVDTQAAILAAGVSKRTLHRRVADGTLTPAGRDHRGRTVYHLDQVLATCQPDTSRRPVDDRGTLTASGTPAPNAG